MARRKVRQPLNVFMNGRLVGQLDRQASGAIDFQYDRSWLEWQHTMPVSLSLPLREDRYIGDPVLAVFDNLLPDTDVIRRRVAEKKGAGGIDAFSLLSVVGRDCVGALQFLPEGEDPGPVGTLSGEELNEADAADLINNLAQAPLGLSRDDEFRISVAGAQEKTALLRKDGQWLKPTGTTPTTHILKPQIGQLPIGVDLTDSVENEHFCLQLLKGFGLDVADSAIAHFGDRPVLVVERFDRSWTQDDRLIRLPQEDCCQALSVPVTRKYQSDGGPGILKILELLQGSDMPAEDRIAFMKAQILFWLIGATDGHAKNFSLFLTPGGRYRMTPLYDVISVQPSFDRDQIKQQAMRLAMSVGDNKHYRLDKMAARHFEQTAKKAGLNQGAVPDLLVEIGAAADRVFGKTVKAMPQGFPAELADSLHSAMNKRLNSFAATMGSEV
ncbi:MAG: type II toxin-antitoxin system HipA family toxin [Stappiaceae bacterium]